MTQDTNELDLAAVDDYLGTYLPGYRGPLEATIVHLKKEISHKQRQMMNKKGQSWLDKNKVKGQGEVQVQRQGHR